MNYGQVVEWQRKHYGGRNPLEVIRVGPICGRAVIEALERLGDGEYRATKIAEEMSIELADQRSIDRIGQVLTQLRDAKLGNIYKGDNGWGIRR